MKDTMTVKELKEALENIPDDFLIRSRAKNAHLDKDNLEWQLSCSDVLSKVKFVEEHKTVMLIRGIE